MQQCKKCGAKIKYIATGLGSSTICDAEKFPFVTENGRKTYGYLIHKCKEQVIENDEKKS